MGQTDIPLNENGAHQAHEVKKITKETRFEKYTQALFKEHAKQLKS